MTSDGEDLSAHGDLFREPEDYYPPEKPATFAEQALRNGQLLRMRLVGHNPLWGHHLWNGGKVIATYLEDNAEHLVRHGNVLELGAGAGLPSLTCAILGANVVVVTDYPDPDLIENLQYNIAHCDLLKPGCFIVAEGFVWGSSTDKLRSYLPEPTEGFDLLILADVLFNHSEHRKLISSVQDTLKRRPHARALVFFTPYRPWLLEKDLAFFDLATFSGFIVEKIAEHVMDEVMFEEDPGDENLRRTVFGYQLKWAHM